MVIQGSQGPSYSVEKLDRSPLKVYFIHIRLYQEQVLKEIWKLSLSAKRSNKLQIVKIL